MKRAAAGILWLIAVAAVGNALAFYAGIPEILAPVAAVAVSAFVVIDPMHLFWSPRPGRANPGMTASSLQAPAK